ncbi:MAG: NUDIX hydrolase [Patescibacteria group bacterium]
MTTPHAHYRISVKALVLDEDKRFLLVQEDNGTWELPGGGLDHGETPHEGLKREIKEEMQIPVTYIKETPDFVTTWEEKGSWKANIIYEASLEHLNFTPSDECVAVKYFTPEEALKESIFKNVELFVRQYQERL